LHIFVRAEDVSAYHNNVQRVENAYVGCAFSNNQLTPTPTVYTQAVADPCESVESLEPECAIDILSVEDTSDAWTNTLAGVQAKTDCVSALAHEPFSHEPSDSALERVSVKFLTSSRSLRNRCVFDASIFNTAVTVLADNGADCCYITEKTAQNALGMTHLPLDVILSCLKI
jgi:hypothetical protein